jgi:rSAM/selenodomain-associated transferase 2
LKLSIIIPVLNEQTVIVNTLQPLQALRKAGHELIIVDADSTDNTPELAAPLADYVLQTKRGRARQMNAGAKLAHNEILLFLHADTHLPAQAELLIINGLVTSKRQWGRFDVRLSGQALLLRLVESLMNWRSCLTGIATGDQAIFIQKSLYNKVQGFPEIPLMEDISLSKKLKCISPPLCIRKKPVITSSRRWEENGIIRTILLMWSLRLAYALGIKPEILKKYYL